MNIKYQRKTPLAIGWLNFKSLTIGSAMSLLAMSSYGVGIGVINFADYIGRTTFSHVINDLRVEVTLEAGFNITQNGIELTAGTTSRTDFMQLRFFNNNTNQSDSSLNLESYSYGASPANTDYIEIDITDDTSESGRSREFFVTDAGTALIQSFDPYLYPSHSSSWKYQNATPNTDPIKFESIRFQSNLIPEPRAYALLLGSLALVGVFLKRRFYEQRKS